MSSRESITRITVTLTFDLLSEFDEAIKGAHYTSRSVAIHEAMRDLLDKLKRRSSR